jgi:hypothetical protein
MNFLGQPLTGDSISSGGVITGDLDIEANLKVTGDTDLNDFTANNGVVTGL